MLSPFDVFRPATGSERRIGAIAGEISKIHRTYLLFPMRESGREARRLTPNVESVPYSLLSGIRFEKIFSAPALLKALRIHRRAGWDYIYAHTLWSAAMGLILRLLTGTPMVLDEHNAEYIRFRRTSSRTWRAVAVYERIMCRKADCLFVVSESDRDFLADLLRGSVEAHVACNGVDDAVFHPEPQATWTRGAQQINEEPFVLFFGNLSYKPNREAVRVIRDEILPRVKDVIPTIRFVIAGRNPPLLGKAGGNLEFVGEYPRIQDLINLSELVICPLISGGGTRLKILESIACGKTVVSTTIGAEGLATDVLGSNLVLADDWGLFSEKVADLFKAKRRDSVPPGFLERYAWRNIVARQILRGVAECRGGHPGSAGSGNTPGS